MGHLKFATLGPISDFSPDVNLVSPTLQDRAMEWHFCQQGIKPASHPLNQPATQLKNHFYWDAFTKYYNLLNVTQYY